MPNTAVPQIHRMTLAALTVLRAVLAQAPPDTLVAVDEAGNRAQLCQVLHGTLGRVVRDAAAAEYRDVELAPPNLVLVAPPAMPMPHRR